MQEIPLHPSYRTAALLMAATITLPVVIQSAHAGEGGYAGYSSLAQREMVRRQGDVAEGDRLLAEGRAAYAAGDYQKAVDKYTQALQKVPDAPLFADRRSSYTSHLSDASVALSMQHRKVGKYTEARSLLENVLAIDPNNLAAKRELGYLDDPIRTNPALTYEHTQNIDKVRRSLYMAEGNYNIGKFDDAKREYEGVLRIDPYNTAARRGMERIASARSDYYRAAYDHTRAELLSQVDAEWELSVPTEAPQIPLGPTTSSDSGTGVAYITEKLRRIIIPRIDFEDTTVEEAIDFLRLRSAELDTLELDPARKGVNFVVRRPRNTGGTVDATLDAGLDATAGASSLPTSGADPGSARIRELRVRNVPLAIALKYVCDATKLRYKVDDFAVTLVPQTETGEDFFTRTFNVPPDFLSSLNTGAAAGGAAGGEVDPFATESTLSGGSGLQARPPIKDVLSASGVKFVDGTSATLSNNGVLLVTNTPTELDKVEQLVDATRDKQPKQVKVTTKFVEITQENGEELGFDWILGPFQMNSNGTVFGSGGTTGTGSPRLGSDFSAPTVDGLSADPTQIAQNIVTAGNRSGDTAIGSNTIDSILNNPDRNSQAASVAPGILSLTGLFSDGQVKVIMRGLSQRKGADLMTAPSITAKSGQVAKIEIIREFIYPSSYSAPEIPTSTGSNVNGTGITGGITGGGGIQTFPVTPANPEDFVTRNTGITLEIEPTIGENDFMIDLRFVPEIVEFEGFINYGSPIQTGGTDVLGNPVTITLTDNRIEMPVFSKRSVTTSLTIYDGYTVALGGLIAEQVQNVEDKVPILGDIPFIGRLFQTKAESRFKSNLIVFVTAQIIDATGRPLRGSDANALPISTGGDLGNLDGVLPKL